MGPSILRLSRLRPLWAGFDAAVRTTLVPTLCREPGVLVFVVGRSGFDKMGPRLMASVWAGTAAVAEASTDPLIAAMATEAGGGVTDVVSETLPVALAFSPDRADDIGIIRVVRGRVRQGLVSEYLEAAEAGTVADLEGGVGPRALYLAIDRPRRQFVTLSLWDSWDHLQASTGADFDAVDRTRHAELLEAWSADHYEAVQGTITVFRAEPEPQPDTA